MNNLSKVFDRLKGLTKAIIRYPLTEAILVAAAILNTIAINTTFEYEKELLSLLVGAVLTATLQGVYERFFTKDLYRFGLMILGALLTFGYYLILLRAPELSLEIMVRTLVALFALLIGYIWVPVIKSKTDFNASFMAVFKAFFQTVLYSGVLYGGVSLIIFAINYLIVEVSGKAFAHSANIVFVLFAPLFFFSLVPVFLGERHKDLGTEELEPLEAAIAKATYCPRFLEILISYIIVPVAAVYTVILVLYIGLNVTGSFWSRNLMEPLLVSYAIAVILVYILSSTIDNKFVNLFRLIFPKVLVPVVVFQIVSSYLNLGNTGIVHTKYYVLLFGAFAACAGVVMSIFPPKRNGIIAGLLIAFALVSIVPPVDAFTVSKNSQINMLEAALEANGMLEDDEIIPNGNVSEDDRIRISQSVSYLYNMGYLDQLSFMPEDFRMYSDFFDTFGFNEYSDYQNGEFRDFYVNYDYSRPFDVSGYDFVRTMSLYEDGYFESANFTDGIETYHFELEGMNLVFMDKAGSVAITFNLDEIMTEVEAMPNGMFSEEKSFEAENDVVKVKLILTNAQIMYYGADRSYYVDFFVAVKFK